MLIAKKMILELIDDVSNLIGIFNAQQKCLKVTT